MQQVKIVEISAYTICSARVQQHDNMLFLKNIIIFYFLFLLNGNSQHMACANSCNVHILYMRFKMVMDGELLLSICVLSVELSSPPALNCT